MYELSVIIVNYNAQHFLQLCLDALATALENIKAEVIVIDNQSNDDSCRIIQEQYPEVKLIVNAENEGFGKANNRAAALAKGKHLLILNPDTIVPKETITASLSILNKDTTIGGIGVKMLDGSGRYLQESKRGLPTPTVAFYKAFGLTQIFPKSKRFARYYLGHLSADISTDVEVLAGAFMLIPKRVYQQCKGFDEDFFMYGEDIDLSYRITQAGYRLHYLANTPIIHFKGECASHDALWTARFYEAMTLFSNKHFASQNKLLNHLINLGILLRKKLVKNNTTPCLNIKPQDINLSVVTNAPLSEKIKEQLAHFKSYHIVNLSMLSIEDENLLFMPDIDKQSAINWMKTKGTSKHFFWTPNDLSFILISPDSQSKGEIIRYA